jgi:hypothetical protein
MLGREGEVAIISSATCECAAGKSASCTHVSALLHVLVSFTPLGLEHTLNNEMVSEETVQPVTSYLCQWNAPRKQKGATWQYQRLDSESTFMVEKESMSLAL